MLKSAIGIVSLLWAWSEGRGRSGRSIGFAAPRYSRAFDARTGQLRWSWDPIPQVPTDPAYDEWGGALAHGTGGANAWSVLAADPERDLVFIPTGSPAPDYYGALRLGDNRYANSIVALRASTGELVWSFQTVHHDLWDYDNAAPPALVSIVRDGISIPAVLQAAKTGCYSCFTGRRASRYFLSRSELFLQAAFPVNKLHRPSRSRSSLLP